MGKGILAHIVAFERQLQDEIAAERVKAEAWRQNELALLERQLEAVRSGRDRVAEEVAHLIASQVPKELEEERRRAGMRLLALRRAPESLNDSLIIGILENILPESQHDHQDG